jgi:hypothetical protein
MSRFYQDAVRWLCSLSEFISDSIVPTENSEFLDHFDDGFHRIVIAPRLPAYNGARNAM